MNMSIKIMGVALAGLLLATAFVPAANAAAINLAPIYGTASQSSTAYDSPGYNGSGPASRAIDGDTSGDYYHGSVSHTGYDRTAFWQVSLGANFALSEITIFNRTDCCTDRLTDFTVSITDASNATVFSQHYAGPVLPSLDIALAPGTAGETVKVQLDGQNYLHLAEVEVFGTDVPEPASYALLAAGLLLVGGLKIRGHQV